MLETVLSRVPFMAWSVAQVGMGWIVADFLSGVIHWCEDRYGSPRWPVFGGAIRDTIRHHRRPRGFLAKSPLARSRRVIIIAVIGFIAFFLSGTLNAFTITLCVAAAVSNEIHVAAHSSPKENSHWVTALQHWGIIQSHAHHALHHRNLKNMNYCTITNWVNPVLERMRFWRRAESLVRIWTGQRPRADPTVRRRQRRLWHWNANRLPTRDGFGLIDRQKQRRP